DRVRGARRHGRVMRGRFRFQWFASNKAAVAGGSEDTYVAGASAVVVATIVPPTERPAGDVVEPLLASLALAVRESGGEAERVTPDGIVAAFPSVAAGVTAALEIHRLLDLAQRDETAIAGQIGVLALETVLSPD